jgi:16S rRNA (cytosine967-C5)-methyltransferase
MYSLALEAITKVINEEGFINIVINESLKKKTLTVHEKKLFTKIVYGVCENKILLDYYLKPYVSGKRLKPYLKNSLRIGVYAFFFMDIANHYVLNSLVDLVKKKDFKGSKLVNGVLRSILREGLKEVKVNNHLEELSIKYSYDLGIVKLLNKYYPKELEGILKHSENVLNTYRINTHNIEIKELYAMLDQDNITYDPHESLFYSKEMLVDTKYFKEGLITLQDYSSQLVSTIINPLKDNCILDMCSAPGSKSCHLASLMKNSGKVVSLDIYEHKLELIKEAANRMHLDIIETRLIDATKFNSNELFDVVLTDVPCSGTGVMRHKVDLKYKDIAANITSITTLQKQILENGSRFVKDGGVLCYSTCSIIPLENELLIKEFLLKHPEYKIEKEIKLLPTNLQDGFYICKMIKGGK